jgi:hypothetical protein
LSPSVKQNGSFLWDRRISLYPQPDLTPLGLAGQPDSSFLPMGLARLPDSMLLGLELPLDPGHLKYYLYSLYFFDIWKKKIIDPLRSASQYVSYTNICSCHFSLKKSIITCYKTYIYYLLVDALIYINFFCSLNLKAN